MKFAIALFAVLAVASAHPGIVDPWAHQVAHYDPWQQQQHGWQQPSHGWQQPSHGWQPSYHQQQHGWHQPSVWPSPTYVKVAPVHHHQVHHHEPHHVHAIHVPQQHPIPPLHPQPVKYKVHHTEPHRIPLHAPHVPHPHLIGYEVQHHEPEIKIKPVHHHPVQHGWEY